MIRDFQGISPKIDKDSFIAENATVIGDVNIEKGASIWYNVVLRGDIENISIGENSNIQDGAVVHTGADLPSKIGASTVVGHRAIVHGAIIGENCLIGMGAIVLNGAVVGDNSIVGAGAVVTEGRQIPPNSLVLGMPGKVIREVSQEEKKGIRNNALDYVKLYKKHK